MAADASFADEVFRYWIPRLLADGVDPNDIEPVRAKATDWQSWPGAWEAQGRAHLELAKERLAAGHKITAGEAYVRACLCFHFGQIVAYHEPAGKARLQAHKEQAFRDAAPLLTPPAQRVEIGWDGIALPGYLRKPAGGGPAPAVVLVPGLDATKEDFHTIVEMCLKRGVATLAYDGPGQGETWKTRKLAEGFERSIVAVVQWLATRPDIDGDRIAVLGRSLGGYYVPRAAALEPRIAGCVVFGGTFDFDHWDDMPASVRRGFQSATGTDSEAAARKAIGRASLEDVIERVRCPTLVVHGKLDAILPWRQAVRIAEAIPGAELLMDEDGVHCCHNHAFRYRTAIADWLATTLGTGA